MFPASEGEGANTKIGVSLCVLMVFQDSMREHYVHDDDYALYALSGHGRYYGSLLEIEQLKRVSGKLIKSIESVSCFLLRFY
jgi:hypothetical protein